MNLERLERARFNAQLRRRGTILSEEALVDVCEALLELADVEGYISLELHERLLREARQRAEPAAPCTYVTTSCRHGRPVEACSSLECHMEALP